jgi:alpha,alpha-trehalase
MVPGGRFLEMYYWDNYWILEGLLISGMFETSKSILDNHIFLIEKYGFVPNGSRVYYLTRSQPPYFALMLMSFYKFVLQSKELSEERKMEYKRYVLNEAFPLAIKEYEFWMRERSVEVIYNSRNFTLNKFNSDSIKPRPESYAEDRSTAKDCQNDNERVKLYKNIAAGAESGIDFSSRWFSDPLKIQTIHTTDIIPVDLNALLYKIEGIISELSKENQDLINYELFKQKKMSRKFIINNLMWSSKLKSWADYDNSKKSLKETTFYLTNLSPLFMGIKPKKISEADLIHNYLDILNKYDGGIPFSFFNSTQQWDFANVWAPNQHGFVTMLLNHDKQLALMFARKFFRSVYRGWEKSGQIFEKYSAVKVGERGSGGEYLAQSGFGWTNGAIIRIINDFGDDLF